MPKPEILLTVPIYAPVLADLERAFTVHKLWTASDAGKFVKDIDEAALIEALKEKRIAGAALDVFWDEPHVPAALMEMDHVVLLPHVGSTTREIREERGRKLMANLHAHFSGKPVPNPVTS